MTKIGIGIVGGGYMGKAHAVAMRAVGAVFDTALRPRLETVCARTPASAGRYCATYGFARATTDWRNLGDDPRGEAVIIASPQDTHRDIAASLDDSRAMGAAAKASGAINMVGYAYEGHGTGYHGLGYPDRYPYRPKPPAQPPGWDGRGAKGGRRPVPRSTAIPGFPFRALKADTMTIQIGNAPCSWGVEFAGNPHNPPWQQVLADCAKAGFKGIELGPVGYMPEDPAVVAEALAEHDLTLTGGVVFRAFHDPAKWDDIMDGAVRTCKALVAHGARHLVLIDSISPRRAPTAGRADEAEQMGSAEWAAFVDRLRTVAKMGTEEFGLDVGIHAHAAGFIDFEPELERLLDEVDDNILKICFDTGHHSYAGFDPVAFMKRHMDRIGYMHFKDIDPVVKARAIASSTGFYDACAQGIFCKLGLGDVDFPVVRQLLLDHGFNGWCTVEQDCDPQGKPSPLADNTCNGKYLHSIGF